MHKTEAVGDGADVVISTWTSANFAMTGNNCPYNVAGTNTYDFEGWNSFQGSGIAGASPFSDNGVMEFICSNSIIKTVVNKKTNTPAFGAGASDAIYDKVFINAWSGNGVNHDLSLHVMSYIYISQSDDDNVNQRIELMTDSSFTNSKNTRLILSKSWTDTQISFVVMDHYLEQGYTHYRITAGSNVIIGAL